MNYLGRIKWSGTDTRRILKWKAEASTFIELYRELVNIGVISVYDNDPYDIALMEKYAKKEADFLDDCGDFSYELFEEWANKNGAVLTDEEIYLLILNQDSNAYYQTFECENSSGELQDISDVKFDESGNLNI